MVTVRAVTPVSVAADVALDAEMPSATTSAAAKSTTFLIEAPLERYVGGERIPPRNVCQPVRRRFCGSG
jgi:hypothetical protein